MKRSRLKIVIVMAALSLLLAVTPMLAQEESTADGTTTEQTAQDSPKGLVTLLLLGGIAAVIAVGVGTWWSENKDRFQATQEKK